MFSQATLTLALAASATAHMIMLNPVPFGKGTINSSPLETADFPCKQRSGVYDVTQMNQWNAGETQVISFQGSAVHGGGSCQFSLTTDPEPTDKSQWKVIQSVVGGCPSNVTGNLDGGPLSTGAATFPVTMPKDIPDGRYTFAWTWLNKVGNREFYMNCAPVQVGSGSGSASTKSVSAALSSLPDMFVANLDSTCNTAENEDFNYPDAGQNVVEGNGAHLGNTLSGSGCSAMTKIGAGNGQLGTPTQPQASAKPSSIETPAATSGYAAVPSSGPGVFAPGASSAAATEPTAEPTTPVAAPTATAAPSQASSAPEQPASSAAPESPENGTTPSNGGDCTPCTTDGAVVCISTTQFGLCNRGCAVPQMLAAGMTCSGGAVVAATKRSFQFPRAHLHRRHGSSRFA
jgi:hypothetical protein